LNSAMRQNYANCFGSICKIEPAKKALSLNSMTLPIEGEKFLVL